MLVAGELLRSGRLGVPARLLLEGFRPKSETIELVREGRGVSPMMGASSPIGEPGTATPTRDLTGVGCR